MRKFANNGPHLLGVSTWTTVLRSRPKREANPSTREGKISDNCGLRRRIHKMQQSPLLRQVFLCGGLKPQRRNAAKTLPLT